MSSKRKATSPIQSREKETKREIEMAEANNTPPQGDFGTGDLDNPNILQTRESLRSQTSRRGSTTSSYLTVASKNSQRTEKPTRESIFVTSKPEGALRDEIVVEFITFGDQPFKGSITVKEARRKVFQEILGFKQIDLAGLKLTYSGGPVAIFKLVAPFNIDLLESIQYFDWERSYDVRGEERTAIMKCKIRGIRKDQRNTEDYIDTGLRWVKIEGSDWRIEKSKMLEWLSFFGEIRSDITEDTHEGSDDSEDDLQPVGSGDYSVRMKLERDIPQFIPMEGRRIRIYYRSITKRCTNCFQAHQRKLCQNEKVPWLNYVKRFAELYPEIPANMYGKWSSMIGTSEGHTEKTKQSNVDQQQQTRKGNPTPIAESTQKEASEVREKLKKTEKERTNEETGTDEYEYEEVAQTEEEKINELVRKMLASGVSSDTLEKRLHTDEKTKMKNQGAGRGRGKGATKVKK